MRRHLRQLLHQAAFLAPILAIVLAMLPLIGPPSVAEAAPEATVTTGTSFKSLVPCLANPTFATTRYADTVFATYMGGPTSPALQTFNPGNIQSTLANLNGIGSVYGLAYDDGSVSGRERLYASAFTKRLVKYGPAGAGGIYAFKRSGSSWVLDGSFTAPGAVGITHNGGYDAPVDTDAIWAVGKTSLGSIVVSPDGKYLYVMNVGVVTANLGSGRTQRGRIERFRLTGLATGQQPVYDSSININYSGISTDANVVNDLNSFALGWYNYPYNNSPILMIGVTDSANRGIEHDSGWVEHKPIMLDAQGRRIGYDDLRTDRDDARFETPPRAYVIQVSLQSDGPHWYGKVTGTDLDLGNDSFFSQRSKSEGSYFEGWAWEGFQESYPVRGWNPWRDQFTNIAGRGWAGMHYPQPLLTDIQIVRTAAPQPPSASKPNGDPEPRGLLVLGFRDRTGDQAFNAGTDVPNGDRGALSQGDTVVFQWNGSNAYSLYRGEYYDDTYLFHPLAAQLAHTENFLGGLARIPGSRTGIGTAGDVMLSTELGGADRQGIQNWDNATAGGRGGFTFFIDGGASATKATNMGDVEVLCSYSLVGGRVWNDVDNTGTQGTSENGIAGVVIEAVRSSDSAVLETATTDSQGRYLFALPPNLEFRLQINKAKGAANLSTYRIVLQNVGNNTAVADGKDSDASPLGASITFDRAPNTAAGEIASPWRDTDLRNYDFGLTTTQGTGYVGDLVWLDSNGDGIQNESPMQGYQLNGTVTLEALSSEPGVKNRTTTVNSDGSYNFNQVVPGTYRIIFPATPAGFRVSPKNPGGNDALDSDVNAGTYATDAFYVYPDDLATPAVAEDRNSTIDFGVIGGHDLWVNKTASSGTAVAGSTFTYNIAYGNQGNLTAIGATIDDTLPVGVTYISASPAPSSTSTGSNGNLRLVWNLGNIPVTAAGVSYGTVRVTVKVATTFTPSSSVTQSTNNCATIAPSLADINTTNNTKCAAVTLQRPEVSITKSTSVGATPSLIGDQFDYTLSYANTGSAPAADVRISDQLPTGIDFVAWKTNPGNACSVSNGLVSCNLGTLTAGATGQVLLTVKSNVLTIPGTTTTQNAHNAVVIGPGPDPKTSTPWPGDTPSNNTSTTDTSVIFPDPTVSIFINPAPKSSDPEKLPVGEDATIDVTYGNPGDGTARSSKFVVTYDQGGIPGTMPTIPGGGVCTVNTSLRQITCPLGDLTPKTATIRTVKLPFHLPATPRDGSTYAGDSYGASVTISTLTPERATQAAGNTQSDTTQVIRPNPRIPSVVGPAAGEVVRMSWGSAYYVTINYENKYLARPYLTRAADNSVLVVRIPDETELLNATPAGYQIDPSDSKKLIWQLGTLAPLQTGSVRVALRTNVPVNSPPLHLTADISTSTYGDDTTDNHGENDTTVMAPPKDYPALTSALQLAIHSELDPLHGGLIDTDAVYYAQQDTIAWPAGEVLDFSPRLTDFDLDPPPFPLEYRARILRWRIVGYEVNGREFTAIGADSRGQAGCRAPGVAYTDKDGLTTCAYTYIGATSQGKTVDSFLPARTLLEAQMATQGHVYWTKPVAPPMRPDVYLFTVDPFEPVKLTVAVDIEMWTMNFCPDIYIDPYVCGTPREEPQPPRQVRPVQQTFTVKLLMPRSVVGPGGVGTTTEIYP